MIANELACNWASGRFLFAKSLLKTYIFSLSTKQSTRYDAIDLSSVACYQEIVWISGSEQHEGVSINPMPTKHQFHHDELVGSEKNLPEDQLIWTEHRNAMKKEKIKTLTERVVDVLLRMRDEYLTISTNFMHIKRSWPLTSLPETKDPIILHIFCKSIFFLCLQIITGVLDPFPSSNNNATWKSYSLPYTENSEKLIKSPPRIGHRELYNFY